MFSIMLHFVTAPTHHCDAARNWVTLEIIRVSPLEWHYSCTILFLIQNPHNTLKANRCIGILGLSQKKNSRPSFCHSERLCCEPWLVVLSLHRSQPPPSLVVGLKFVCFYGLKAHYFIIHRVKNIFNTYYYPGYLCFSSVSFWSSIWI